MIRRLFFDGLKVFLPFLVAVWLLSWIFRWIDSMLAPIVVWITGWEHPILGSGVLLGILLVFLLGLCVRIPFVRDLIKKLQRNFRRLPGVNQADGGARTLRSVRGVSMASHSVAHHARTRAYTRGVDISMGSNDSFGRLRADSRGR